jgi:hypothetical protein
MVSEHIVGVRAGPPFTDIMVPRASSFAATSTRIKIKGGRWWKAKKKAQKSRLSREGDSCSDRSEDPSIDASNK